ncbi:MAG: asparagine synthase (glutamine-hydrolyzing) [Verrucomicrobia bacterium]|nr:asparagine synthase (glutamine-hydrolyzing) [Verrucomicrobiota bacterium]
MCGIAGIWFSEPIDAEALESQARRMGRSLRHRGPDAGGVWVDPAAALGLSHRRLSILDLSDAGAQPMRSQSGRHVMVYNGECYNFPELRRELESGGCEFRSKGDTEVILEACVRWGVRETLERLNGMFAFALWDEQLRELVLARDRIGIKPLYYGWAQGLFWFGSELKALRVLDGVQPRVDVESLGLFFKYGYVPAPHSIFLGFRKLPSACYVVVRSASRESEPECYWPLVRNFGMHERDDFGGGRLEAVEELDALLRRSVRRQMISDVPLGAFLSGGIDSSTVVALMQAQSSRAVKTFTIGFEEAGFNEADSARQIARHLGTDHTELVLTPGEAQKIVPSLGGMFDEPFADASQIPTWAVSRLTRTDVTVSLSGDGGDELFAGYRNYALNAARLRRIDRLPTAARRWLSSGARTFSEAGWDRMLDRISGVLPAGSPGVRALCGHKLHKYAAILASHDTMRRRDLMDSHWFAPEQLVRAFEPDLQNRERFYSKQYDPVELMAAADLLQYLPDDILTKLDRASMAVGLESRVPVLDHEVVEFALRLPLAFKRTHGEGKWILRQVLGKYVPSRYFNRPKQGFSVPVAAWIRGPLRDWAEVLINSACNHHDGLLDGAIVRAKWQDHLRGRRNWEKLLWPVLMFEAWSQHDF